MKKYDVKKLVSASKSPEALLDQVIIPNILKDPNALYSSEKLPIIDLSLREILGLVLVSFVFQNMSGKKLLPASNPDGRDGYLVWLEERDSVGIPFEQVFVTKFESEGLESAIVQAVKNKSAKGVQYAKDYGLIVFSSKKGEVQTPRLRKNISFTPFESVWWISRTDKKDLKYFVSLLKSNGGDPLGDYIVLIEPEKKTVTVNHLIYSKKAPKRNEESI